MEIIAEKIGKKFNKEWIFRNFSFTLNHNQSFAITGPNGSGKSTLLQVLSGATIPSEGQLFYQQNKLIIQPESFYQYITLAAPYLELIEEMTIRELADFHKGFKPFTDKISTDQFLEKIKLEHAADKEIRILSSGMKQRVKLGLAIFSNSPILLLDEPTTNLDSKGIDWYLEEINKQIQKRTILICSNQRYEHDFCDKEINVQELK